jgi:hypothetical protein
VEVQVGTFIFRQFWARPDGDGAERWKGHARRKSENDDGMTLVGLFQNAAANLVILSTIINLVGVF